MLELTDPLLFCQTATPRRLTSPKEPLSGFHSDTAGGRGVRDTTVKREDLWTQGALVAEGGPTEQRPCPPSFKGRHPTPPTESCFRSPILKE